MAEEPTVLDSVEEPSVTDPLSEVTRRDRRALLAACIVGLAISAGGLVPERIETFGISVSAQQENSLLYILGGVICYFLLSFGVYASADLRHRDAVAAKHRERLRPVIQEATAAYQRTQEQLTKPNAKNAGDALNDPDFMKLAGLTDQMKLARRVNRVGAIRVLVDVYFPMVAGITAAVVVWSSTSRFPGWGIVGLGALGAATVSGAFLAWWRRRALCRWWRKKRHNVRSRRQKRLMEKAQALPEGDPRKADLLAKARELLMKSIEDFEDGIY